MSDEKLYKLTGEVVVYFINNNEFLLKSDAKKYLEEDIRSNGCESFEKLIVDPVVKWEDVSDDWKNAIPWGADKMAIKDDMTIKEFFNQQETPSCDGKIVVIDGKKYKLSEVK